MILVTSSESNNCYVDTASIDGETALKLRRAPQLQTSPSWMQAGPKNEQKIHAKLTCLRGFVECDLPNEKIGVFNGNLELEGHDKIAISRDHIVLRGSSLHTDWLLGIVVYTGRDTKLAKLRDAKVDYF